MPFASYTLTGLDAFTQTRHRNLSQLPAISPPMTSPSPTAASSPPNPAHYTHLVVLVHGFVGTRNDMGALRSALESLQASPLAASGAATAPRILVHASPVNEKRHSKDGIDLGGARLAADVRAVAAAHPFLDSISFVGHSMGGLYSRYAIAHLLDRANNSAVPHPTICGGLRPRHFITLASPHLGVRQFGVFRFLPGPVERALLPAYGRSVRQLLLADRDGGAGGVPLLVAMAEGEEYLGALRAFGARTAYGSVRNDFLVPFGTATLRPECRGVKGKMRMPEGAEVVESGYDARGCRVWFTTRCGVQDSAEACGRESGLSSPVGVMKHESGDSLRKASGVRDAECAMAARLSALGWNVVAVDFRKSSVLPLAHNRIVASRRSKMYERMNLIGTGVIDHVVRTLLEPTDANGKNER
mmetsp:Transcript_26243/g.65617  ORF Transcript_26243/g.65617 Transcript_26243/m.65617 type:complete len:415 (+) Transcript_26243:311-1555(+)